MEKFATITASSGVAVADHAGKAESRSRDADKIPKLRNLKKEEDEEAYFNAFEAHMDSYAVDKESWVKHLTPVLNPDASEVYMGLDTGDRKDYMKVEGCTFRPL